MRQKWETRTQVTTKDDDPLAGWMEIPEATVSKRIKISEDLAFESRPELTSSK